MMRVAHEQLAHVYDNIGIIADCLDGLTATFGCSASADFNAHQTRRHRAHPVLPPVFRDPTDAGGRQIGGRGPNDRNRAPTGRPDRQPR
jgi:hypothetical protein